MELSAFQADPCGGYFAISTCTPSDDYKAPQHDDTSQASWPEQCVGEGDMGAATNRNGVMFIVKEWISFPTYKYKALPPAGYRLVIDRQYTEEDKWLEYGFVPASATPAPGLSAKATAARESTQTAEAATAVPESTAATEVPPTTPTLPPPAEVAQGRTSKLAPATRVNMYKAAPPMTIDPTRYYYATLKTGKGDIKIELFADLAPITVNNFVFLAHEGYYNDTTFYQVIPGFMAEAGDPTGTGRGGPGYEFVDEFYPGGAFDRVGLLGMANDGPNSNGSRFFITFDPANWLEDQNTVFGEVIEGQVLFDKLTRREPGSAIAGDKLYTVIIEESGVSVLPTPTPLPPTPTPFAPTSLAPGRPLADVALAKRAGYFNAAPAMTIDTSRSYTATISTNKGDFVVTLYDDLAPTAVNNFVVLANLGFYDNVPINDINRGQVMVFGSPTGDPEADAGYTIKPETGLPITLDIGSSRLSFPPRVSPRPDRGQQQPTAPGAVRTAC